MQDIRWSWRRTVHPTLLPVTLKEAKEECDIYDDDSLNERFYKLIVRATDQVERHSRRALMTQTWKLWMDRFPCELIELRKYPVQSVTHVKSTIDGVPTTWSSSLYQTDLDAVPPILSPIDGEDWPSFDCGTLKAVEVQWVAGYATQAALDAALPCAKSAVLMAVRGLYFGCGMSDNYWGMIESFKEIGFVA